MAFDLNDKVSFTDQVSENSPFSPLSLLKDNAGSSFDRAVNDSSVTSITFLSATQSDVSSAVFGQDQHPVSAADRVLSSLKGIASDSWKEKFVSADKVEGADVTAGMTSQQKEMFEAWQKAAGKLGDPSHPFFKLQQELGKQFCTGSLDVEKLQALMKSAKLDGQLPIILGRSAPAELKEFERELFKKFGIEITIHVKNEPGNEIGIERIDISRLRGLDTHGYSVKVPVDGAAKGSHIFVPSDPKLPLQLDKLPAADVLVLLNRAATDQFSKPKK